MDFVPPRSTSRLRLRAVVAATLVLGALLSGCASDDDLPETCRLTYGSLPPPPACSENPGPIVNECGTFDPDEEGTDSVIPQDPADPEIVGSCEALCDAYATIDGCAVDAAACLESCRLRSCDVCPGSLADLTDCEAEFFDASACTCEDGVVTCETPASCSDERTSTGACGG
jgi:hypothetical protein